MNDRFNFLSRWELSEEEESGGSDVETLVNQQQTAVSQTLITKDTCTCLLKATSSVTKLLLNHFTVTVCVIPLYPVLFAKKGNSAKPSCQYGHFNKMYASAVAPQTQATSVKSKSTVKWSSGRREEIKPTIIHNLTKVLGTVT